MPLTWDDVACLARNDFDESQSHTGSTRGTTQLTTAVVLAGLAARYAPLQGYWLSRECRGGWCRRRRCPLHLRSPLGLDPLEVVGDLVLILLVGPSQAPRP